MNGQTARLSLLTHPYHELTGLTGGKDQLRSAARHPGTALVWVMGPAARGGEERFVTDRPGGVSLLVVLPPASELDSRPELVQLVQGARPRGILPYHHDPSPAHLAQVLRRPPDDLAADVTDYLAWRGIVMDRDTARVIRRIVELSEDLRTISALSRGMYMSRRALGRRFMSRGLPVPSHWLQVGRLLRVAIKLQNADASVFSIAYELGYPDGFAVSNQMHRLIGHRPSDVREHLGWEWILEAWLRREAEIGALAPNVPHGSGAPIGGADNPSHSAPRPRRRRMLREGHHG